MAEQMVTGLRWLKLKCVKKICWFFTFPCSLKRYIYIYTHVKEDKERQSYFSIKMQAYRIHSFCESLQHILEDLIRNNLVSPTAKGIGSKLSHIMSKVLRCGWPFQNLFLIDIWFLMKLSWVNDA